jgi:hypothetical protein
MLAVPSRAAPCHSWLLSHMTMPPQVPEKTSRPRHEARTLARLGRALENSQALRTQRLRGPGESVVVIASAPPRTHLVISVSAAQGQAPTAQGLAGMTVAVRAVPILQQDVDEDGATCVFDRQHVLPAATEPIGTPAGVFAEPGGQLPPIDLPAAPSLRTIGGAEPAWAQDTLRCVAQTVAKHERTPTAGWFGLSAACLLASAVALYTGMPAAEDAPSRLVVRGGDGSVAAESSVAPAAQPIKTPARAKLATSRPVASPPRAAARATPSARLELHELTLDVTATPWMEVLVDGRSLGHTPRLNVELSPGAHEITLVNRDLDLSTRTVVSAERGSSETQDIAFE